MWNKALDCFSYRCFLSRSILPRFLLLVRCLFACKNIFEWSTHMHGGQMSTRRSIRLAFQGQKSWSYYLVAWNRSASGLDHFKIQRCSKSTETTELCCYLLPWPLPVVVDWKLQRPKFVREGRSLGTKFTHHFGISMAASLIWAILITGNSWDHILPYLLEV